MTVYERREKFLEPIRPTSLSEIRTPETAPTLRHAAYQPIDGRSRLRVSRISGPRLDHVARRTPRVKNKAKTDQNQTTMARGTRGEREGITVVIVVLKKS